MRAHDDRGKPGVNIAYEDLKRAADANGTTVEQALETIAQPADIDRADHPAAVSGNDRARSIRSRVVAQADGLADP